MERKPVVPCPRNTEVAISCMLDGLFGKNVNSCHQAAICQSSYILGTFRKGLENNISIGKCGLFHFKALFYSQIAEIA